MAKVRFRLYDDRGVPSNGPPADNVAETDVPLERADTFWWDSAWELLHGLDVIELADPPADYFAHLAPRSAGAR